MVAAQTTLAKSRRIFKVRRSILVSVEEQNTK